MLPRNTREHKLHLADTLSYETRRVHWKFGGDFIQAWIYNYYPSMSGGEYYFDNVKVNPWTFAPMKYGEPLTPLRAYAHDVPRYYMQDFGTAVSHPNSRFYSAFMQDTIRVSRNFTLNVGVRYDLQTFQAGNLISNPLYPPSGKIPTDREQRVSADRLRLGHRRPASADGSRRRRPLLHPDPVDVRFASRHGQRNFAEQSVSGSHDPGTSGGISEISQSAGQLPSGDSGVCGTTLSGRPAQLPRFRPSQPIFRHRTWSRQT